MEKLNDNINKFQSEFFRIKHHYSDIIKKAQIDILANFTGGFNNIKSNYLLFSTVLNDFNVKEAVDFNVFNIVRIGNLEVRTHTPFLAELLNGNGSHGQRNLFLSGFLRKFKSTSNESNDDGWKVIHEKDFVDIQIVNHKLRKAIFIENKIYTEAHSGQLSRYYRLWKKRFKGGAFLYLTLNGVPPNDEGFDHQTPKEKTDILCFSFKSDIINWLQETVPFVESLKVKFSLFQYIDLLNKL